MKDFDSYSEENVHFYNVTVPSLLKKYLPKVKDGGRYIDLGCGDGGLLIALKSDNYFSRFSDVYALDLSKTRLKRVEAILPDVKTVVASAMDLSVLDKSFDFLVSTQVIEHVPDDRGMLKEVYNVANDGAYFFVSSVVRKKYAWWIYKCNGETRLDPTHVREYASKDAFVKLIESEGFEVLDVDLYRFKPSILNFLLRGLKKMKLISEKRIRKISVTKWYRFLLKVLVIPVPRYFIVEVMARKK